MAALDAKSLPVLSHGVDCLLCGAALVYLAEAEPMVCATCGARIESRARCGQGHFVCDACHGASAADVIERCCAQTSETDPVRIAVTLMRHPSVKMHGPEHHFLVPAALVAAFCNARGEPEKKPALVQEARRRSASVLGGFCGFQGACGAGIGTGTFVALVTGSTPLKGHERGLANRMTAEALALIGRTDGARCCKRDGFLALLAAARFVRRELGVELHAKGPACEFHERNRDCIETRCPFRHAAA
jgi:hypothetical protein